MTPALLPLPDTHSVLTAPAPWRAIDFLSDLHLGPDTPLTFDAWEAHMRLTDADAVFILGDLVEMWVGDDGRFDGFDARFTAALTAAAQRRPTYFMIGNRDFMVGREMLDACDVTPLPDPTSIDAFGQRALFVHGDELCLADTDYQRFRKQVRNPAWQQQMLTQSLAMRRQFARDLREKSEAHQRLAGKSSELWADIDAPTAIHWLDLAGARVLVHGHTHRPATEMLSPTHQRHVLSDWDLDHPPQRAGILRWTAAGFERRPPATAPA